MHPEAQLSSAWQISPEEHPHERHLFLKEPFSQ